MQGCRGDRYQTNHYEDGCNYLPGHWRTARNAGVVDIANNNARQQPANVRRIICITLQAHHEVKNDEKQYAS